MSNPETNETERTAEDIVRLAGLALDGTKEYMRHVQEHIIPIFDSLIDLNVFEQAIWNVYYRACYNMRTLTKLEDYNDYQVVRSVTRTMCEFYWDLKTLEKDPSIAAKYHAFVSVERMRTAIQVADFVAANPSEEWKWRNRHAITLASDATKVKECEDTLRTAYGIETDIERDRHKKFPKSWCRRSAKDQAKEIGVEEELRYRAEYSIGSWFIHGGFAGIAGIPDWGLINLFGRGHLMTRQIFHEMTVVICRIYKLSDALPNLLSTLNSLNDKPGVRFILPPKPSKSRGYRDESHRGQTP